MLIFFACHWNGCGWLQSGFGSGRYGKTAIRLFFTALYIVGFVYNTYDTVIFAIYNEYPNLYETCFW